MRSGNMRMRLLGSSTPSLKGCCNKYLRVITLEEITFSSSIPRHFLGNLDSCSGTKVPKTIQEAHEIATRIEANLSSSKVEPFYAPRTKVDVKPKVVHNTETTQDISVALARLQETVDGMERNQTLMMNIITNLERAQQQAPNASFQRTTSKSWSSVQASK
jgi:hypothetical protein